jgi:predicted nuclease of restriction endonuclease-like (RecB) superfamily
MNTNENLPAKTIETLYKEVKQVIESARKEVYHTANIKLLEAYWIVGKLIVEKEQEGKNRAAYGRQVMVDLSRKLTEGMGRGFSLSNLFNMKNFYLTYPIFQTVSGKLSWSHYCELLVGDDALKRSFYQQESINSNWSVRELKRQMNSSLFERLLLSEGTGNKEIVLKLSREGQMVRSASDMIKDPYVFEFLGVPERKPMLEKELEAKLIRHIEDFLLELGKGFMFVGSQQRITLGNEHYYVDMVFYNKILKAYVLIDLKSRKLKHFDVGQMNTYLNYYKAEISEETDNDPIGIILCTEKSELEAQYALGGLTNQVFASKYVYHLPDKELLIQQVEEVIEKE